MTSSELLLDSVLADAQEQARAALIESVPTESIGDHLGVEMEAENLATHLFACLNPGYVDWRWAVTVARAPDSDHVTICESVLLPGEGALLAPEWLPWESRVQAGDLGVGDVLPPTEDDIRLVPGYTGADDDTTENDDLVPIGWELGLGRVRVLSITGRDEAAQRWFAGDTGPKAAIARAATHSCSTCGFLVPMSGPLGRGFGLCANEFSPADGRVVSMNHGCGAHSDAEPEPVAVAIVELAVDDHSPEMLDTDELTAAELAADEVSTEELVDSVAVETDDESVEDVPGEELADQLDPTDNALIDVIEDALIEAEADAVEEDSVVEDTVEEEVANEEGKE